MCKVYRGTDSQTMDKGDQSSSFVLSAQWAKKNKTVEVEFKILIV